MSLLFFKKNFAYVIVLVSFSLFLFPESVHADSGHNDPEVNHVHCASGVILYGSAPDCGDEDSTNTTVAQGNCPAGTVPAGAGGICLPTEDSLGIQDDPVQNILLSITLFVTGLIGVLAVLMIVVSGVMYMLSAGDTARAETAKKILTYAIIGLIVALLAWVIVSVVSRVTGAGGLEAGNTDNPVNGTMTEVCPTPDFCFMIENTQ